MKAKTPLKILGINLILFGALFGLISVNKDFLRPMSSHHPVVGILTGSFPNFIAAYIISLAPANAVLIRQPKNGRLIVYLAASLVFLVLAVEEIVPMWGASTHYDLYDIIGSFLGSVLAVLTYESIQRSKLLTRKFFSPD